MQQRGRRSANELGVIPLAPMRQRIQAPRNVSATERRMFNELVASVHAEHFVQSDWPLLTAYVQCTLLVRKCSKASTTGTKTAEVLGHAVRAQIMLATKLRLSPQGRISQRTAGRQSAKHNAPSFYDLMGQRHER